MGIQIQHIVVRRSTTLRVTLCLDEFDSLAEERREGGGGESYKCLRGGIYI
jgi:hypothetical protein